MSSRALPVILGVLVAAGVALGLTAVISDRSAVRRPGPAATASSTSATTGTGAQAPAGSSSGAPRPAAPRPTDRPASYGEPLGVVQLPPPDTVVLVASRAASEGATYDTVFTPYGFAARASDLRDPAAGADGLVVKVIASTPGAGTGPRLVLSGRNLLVGLTAHTLGKVVTGGQYSGTIVLLRRGSGLVPVLTTVMVARRR